MSNLSVRWLASDYFNYFFTNGIFFPFISVWLNYLGIEASKVGILISSGLIARFIGSLVIMKMVDRIGQTIVFIRCLSVITLILSFGFLLCSSWICMLLIIIGFNFFFSPMIPLTDVLTSHLQRKVSFEYGKVRVWGSVSFILSSFLTGYAAHQFGYHTIIYMLLVSEFFTSFSLMIHPNIKLNLYSKRDRKSLRKEKNSSFFEILKEKEILKFLFCTTLLQSSHAAYYGFSSVYWKEIGYSIEHVGTLWSVSIFSEIVLLIVFEKIKFKFCQVRSIFLYSTFFTIVRWNLVAFFSKSFIVLLFSQLLHSGTFTLCHLASIEFINRHSSKKIILLNALYSSLGLGIGLAILAVISGFIYQNFPSRHNLVFFLMSLIASPVVFLRIKA
ncbi:3-phenylpropionate MFS transporter [Candidatus Riesia pediculicola]|uniref:Probable 3-phenylpropionic acid transporter n=1 Tax=Riesia pediculicola (strain USDA) TaxID=515618 RepID=D4G8C5_RIEPU|nr:3-phenylpropionate MFS transporter [Candidatus Riesia pediculicola]ADD79912.1 probable 3-phenylpropionic acid transporter [Candidatus Riesia pediculicola USDA]QOJ86450.1 3-phenylpropionate MFS transporter [Candidatus Riesia pediculicola]